MRLKLITKTENQENERALLLKEHQMSHLRDRSIVQKNILNRVTVTTQNQPALQLVVSQICGAQVYDIFDLIEPETVEYSQFGSCQYKFIIYSNYCITT